MLASQLSYSGRIVVDNKAPLNTSVSHSFLFEMKDIQN